MDWNATAYHRVSEPQRLWGEKVLATLDLEGDETVLDAGCGTGHLTRRLLERLPRGRVIALDASPNMLDVARKELADFGDRVAFVQANLGKDALPSNVDVVFSTATFHWVHDHDTLFRTIAEALVPGGRLHAQCGGEGNLDRAHALTEEVMRDPRYAEHFPEPLHAWNFAGIDITRTRLRAVGLDPFDVNLELAPTPFADRAAYREFVTTVVLRPFLAKLPEDLRAPFADEVTTRAAAADPPLTLDYVRLNLRATRSS